MHASFSEKPLALVGAEDGLPAVHPAVAPRGLPARALADVRGDALAAVVAVLGAERHFAPTRGALLPALLAGARVGQSAVAHPLRVETKVHVVVWKYALLK